MLGLDAAARHDGSQANEGVWVRSMYFRDPNGIHMEPAAFTRAWRPSDVAHDPVNARGEHVAAEPVA